MHVDTFDGLIRKATSEDLERISEIYSFNYRLNFYSLFKNDQYYFEELKVSQLIKEFSKKIDELYVYDDGVVKGFAQVKGHHLHKLFVEPVLQNQGIGAALLNHFDIHEMWVLLDNQKAIAFYKRHGFELTSIKLPEANNRYLVLMKKGG